MTACMWCLLIMHNVADINIRILHTTVSQIPFVLRLRIRESDPHVYVVFGARMFALPGVRGPKRFGGLGCRALRV